MTGISRSPAPGRLKIAFLDSWLQSAVEGSGTAVGIAGLEQALRRKGHHVDRITPQAGGWRASIPVTLRRILFNLMLPAQLQGKRYDVIVGFDWDGVGVPRMPSFYVCSIKGIIAEELQHERGGIRLLFNLLARLEGANAGRADRVITTSEYCRDRIAHHYHVPQARIGVVPEGIDVAMWTRELAAAPPRSDNRLTILCVARQYPRKHIADLLHALARLRRYMPSAQLRLVGDGPEHGTLLELARSLGIAEHVLFLGGLPDAQVRHEYAHCDVFCLPSVQEGFGIVLLEAMVAGKPIVSTMAAAIPEVVQHGTTGILVPPGDPHSLAGALLLLLADRDRREQYGRAARASVMLYDWPRVAELFLKEVRSRQ